MVKHIFIVENTQSTWLTMSKFMPSLGWAVLDSRLLSPSVNSLPRVKKSHTSQWACMCASWHYEACKHKFGILDLETIFLLFFILVNIAFISNFNHVFLLNTMDYLFNIFNWLYFGSFIEILVIRSLFCWCIGPLDIVQ